MEKIIQKQNNNRYFRTKNFYLACFLFSRGMELAGINEIKGLKQKEFVFRDTPLREKWVNDYNFAQIDSPGLILDVRKFIYAIKMLKERLNY